MRLFIAINFDEDTKNHIKNIREKVKKDARQGRFTSRSHMHLTLEFLGEVSNERKKDIISEMEHVATGPFTLSLSHLGYFKRRDGNIYWLGIKENKHLMDMQKELHKLLLERSFKLEKREYRPHITIGRRVKLSNTFNSDQLKESIGKIHIDVHSIDLMKSQRIDGKLIYRTIFSKPLKMKNHLS